ncbi:ethanolamine utilization protein [Achromobacter sp. GG226]|uniref:exonuclease domain-containing protein n=1 Tax=Verticiella alkaliphila TaxID=2779529 RepID=UPI001C0C076B|nr:exonuclease domain-containing protein [Verticiella sp. GG226]MBU4611004.1 ethanolamine utilization protein [Verticiella sp. GG226]
MSRPYPPLAFVDLETTGGSAQSDRITEIAILRFTPDGVDEWSTLVNPGRPIPRPIQSLTGINDAMVADAPVFDDIADEVRQRLAGHVFVAHNARFDHGFLKNAFARLDVDFRPRVLCTVRLSRRLYPDVKGHGLDAVIRRHGLDIGEAAAGRHRALGDTRALVAFWQHLQTDIDAETLRAAVTKLCALPSLPPGLPAELPDQLPRTPGVYRFAGVNDAPLYIGKAVDLRRRVLSHFSGDHARATSMELSRQVRAVTWTATTTELEALLVEAGQVKAQSPLYNRQLRKHEDVFAWQVIPDLVSGRLVLSAPNDPRLGASPDFYGIFSTRARARSWLRHLVDEHGLCAVHTGVEKQSPGKPCFARQLHRCLGACTGHESTHAHFERLMQALEPHAVALWPHAGALTLPGAGMLHVLNRWAYVGAAANADEAEALGRQTPPAFDADIYRILRGAQARAAEPAQEEPAAA